MAGTVGDVLDKQGPCLLMALVVELAERCNRLPVGHWQVDLGEGWQLEINGTREVVNSIQPWEALIERHGLPMVSFNAVEGIAVNGSEDAAVDALRRAIANSA